MVPRLLRRAIRLASYVPGRLSELVPPVDERCGRSPGVGGARVLAASLWQLRDGRSDVRVILDGGPTVVADLRTPHGRRLFGYGFCEPAAVAMRALLEPGDVMIDGGANIGLFTLLAAARVGAGGRVIACEPSPTTMGLLAANVARNDYEWVDLREVALADVAGRLSLEVFDPGSGFSSFAPAASGRQVEVEVTTLDEVADEVMDRLALVKLDVEGAELRALKGASRILEAARPDFIVELEPEHLERQQGSIAEIQRCFEDAGYVGYAISGGTLHRLEGVWGRPAGDPNIVVRPAER